MNRDSITYWKTKHTQAQTGNAEKQYAQHTAGKKTARERINVLLDAESFEEIDQLAISPHLKEKYYTDGVITGFGTVQGKRVAIYAQDFTIKGGSLGKRHAEKICKIMDTAAKIGCPIIGIIDSGGARIDEGIHALSGYGSIFFRNVRYSGVVPQISIIVGPCAGGAAYSPALTDFVIMTKEISQMFITGPQVIQQVLNYTISKEDLGGWRVHGQQSGVVHIVADNEELCFVRAQQLIDLLPSNYLDGAPPIDTVLPDPRYRNLLDHFPEKIQQTYDMKHIIYGLIDHGTFFEIHELFAPNIIVGFARIEGKVVGIVANQPLVKAGTIDIDASTKAARFIQFCDSFDIPIISLVDVPGYLPGVEQEHNGIIRHGSKLLYAYAQASVPKITVILRKAFGGAYIVMGSKELGGDFNYAWPTAQIAVLGAKGAVAIVHAKTLAKEPIETRVTLQSDLEKEYETLFLNPYTAAEYGYIDAIIDPLATRNHLIKALAITAEKVEHVAKKKHGNIPL